MKWIASWANSCFSALPGYILWNQWLVLLSIMCLSLAVSIIIHHILEIIIFTLERLLGIWDIWKTCPPRCSASLMSWDKELVRFLCHRTVFFFFSADTRGKAVKEIYNGTYLPSLSIRPSIFVSILFLWGLLLENILRECLSTNVLVGSQLCFSACSYHVLLEASISKDTCIDTTSAGRGLASLSNGKQICFLTRMMNILSLFRQRLGRVNSL